jgi:ABC-2 type transport system ATP-binding protein
LATAVEVRKVSKVFRLFQEKYTSLKERVIHMGKVPYEQFPALSDISFEVEQGTTLGLLGHNGSGKSTLLKCIAGILTPTTGEILVRGRVAAMLELGAGFHPDLSGRDNIYLNASLLGLSRKEVDRRFDDIVDFSELGSFIDNQVKYYSSGMYARLGFAVAVNMDPDVLLVDEVLAVGDANFALKCINRIRQFQEEGRTIIFVSHSPDMVRSVCDSAYVLDHGRLVGGGPTQDAIALLQKFQIAGSGLMKDPSRDHAELVPAFEQEVRVSSLLVNGISVERSVELKAKSEAEMTVEIASHTGMVQVHLEMTVTEILGTPLYRFNTLEMGMDPFLVREKARLSVLFSQFLMGAGTFNVTTSLYDAQTGALLESRKWDNAIMVVGVQEGTSGFVAMDVNVYGE